MDWSDGLSLLSDLGERVIALRSALEAQSLAIAGRPIPAALYPAAVFAPLILWSFLTRSPTAALCVGVLAWLACVSLMTSADPTIGALQFAGGVIAALLLLASAHRCARRAARLAQSLRSREEELVAAVMDLDRERLWRRASGGDGSALDYALVRGLAERVTKAAQSTPPQA